VGAYGPFPQEMVDAANEQIDYFVSVLEKRGVKVDRPEIHPCMFNKPVSTPDWTQLNCYGINNPRDVFLCHSNYLIEAATSMHSRWYEYLNLRPLFEQYFKDDPELVWFTAPRPRLTDESYVRNYYYSFHWLAPASWQGSQTIMMALAMVVIASMIGASGLGLEVLRGIERLDVGRGFLAGSAIVIVAIMIDRISQSLGKANSTTKLLKR